MDKEIYNRIKEDVQNAEGIKAYCLNYMLDNYDEDDELETFVSDLLSHGCQSGMVCDLIYYSDTISFYDDYENDIGDLITQNMEMLGVDTRPLFIESLNGSAENLQQEKNLLAWFSFEETIRSLKDMVIGGVGGTKRDRVTSGPYSSISDAITDYVLFMVEGDTLDPNTAMSFTT